MKKPPTPPNNDYEILRELCGSTDKDTLLGELTDLPTADDLIRDAASLTTVEALVRDAPTIKQDIDTLLLTPDEKDVSRLLGCYAVRKPARRCRRPHQPH